MNLDVIDYQLRLARPLHEDEAAQLRGYFGRVYEDEVALHHHRPGGGLVYDYPRVQYKVLDRAAHVVGLGSEGELVQRLWLEVEQARLGDEIVPVLDATLTRRTVRFGQLPAPAEYCFRTPWLALNQANHALYQQGRDPARRRDLLARILVGNCLSLAKAFCHNVTERLLADVTGLAEKTTYLKGMPMLAFVGTFRVNFAIPNLAGIGKSVSRGFGTVARLTPEVDHADR